MGENKNVRKAGFPPLRGFQPAKGGEKPIFHFAQQQVCSSLTLTQTLMGFAYLLMSNCSAALKKTKMI